MAAAAVAASPLLPLPVVETVVKAITVVSSPSLIAAAYALAIGLAPVRPAALLTVEAAAEKSLASKAVAVKKKFVSKAVGVERKNLASWAVGAERKNLAS